MEKGDKKRFWLGAFLAIAGTAMLFIAMIFLEPKGEISGSVIGGAGEVFTLAGCLLGLDSYVNFKIKNYLATTKNTTENNDQ